jgi:pimeloyl-ACP methyl ester carboxylesterase
VARKFSRYTKRLFQLMTVWLVLFVTNANGQGADAPPTTLYDRVMNALGDSPRAPGTNFMHRPGTVLKAEADSLVVEVHGGNGVPVVILSGMGQNSAAYETLFYRNQERFSFHTVLLPGYAGTPAYPWPSKPEDFVSLDWLTSLSRDLENYLSNVVTGPVVLVSSGPEMYPFAIRYASTHPKQVRGLLLTGLVGRQGQSPYNRWYNATPEELATIPFDLERQKEVVHGGFRELWRSVDVLMWWENSRQAQALSNDPVTALSMQAYRTAQPFNIYMRYFAESLLMDITEDLRSLSVPTVALLNQSSVATRIEAGIEKDDAIQAIKDQRNNIKRDWQIVEPGIASIEYIEDAGLALWVDAPESFDHALNQLSR